MKLNTQLSVKDFTALCKSTDNIYEAVAIISRRARQIAVRVKEELDNKFTELIPEELSDQAEEAIEVSSDKARISEMDERKPKPAKLATEEFLADKLMYRYLDET